MRNDYDCGRKRTPLIAFYSQLQPSLFQQKILRTEGSLTALSEAYTVFEALIEFACICVHNKERFIAGVHALHAAGAGYKCVKFWIMVLYLKGSQKQERKRKEEIIVV